MAGEFIISEKNLRERDQWLETHAAEVAPYLRDGRDCIVFTFTRREPQDRQSARVGGLPYWPRAEPWPECGSCGELLLFVAQLDFSDPRVRLGVPGDVLTVHHCLSCYPWSPEDPGGGLLTWHDTIPLDALITAADVPEFPESYRFGPFYGEPHDAVDYPTPPEAYGGGIAGESYSYLHFTLQGTKIGGYPPPIQEFEVPVDSRQQPMRFLASIGSVQGYVIDGTGSAVSSQGDFLWGDMGCLFLWISKDVTCPEMTWFIECY